MWLQKSIPDKASLQPFMMSSASHVGDYPWEIWRDVSNVQHWKARSIMQSSDFIPEGRLTSATPTSHSCSHLSIHLWQCKLFSLVCVMKTNIKSTAGIILGTERCFREKNDPEKKCQDTRTWIFTLASSSGFYANDLTLSWFLLMVPS